MSEKKNDQFDYPVDIGDRHEVVETMDYSGDRFKCRSGAYTHTGAWPTWNYCPYCGEVLKYDE